MESVGISELFDFSRPTEVLCCGRPMSVTFASARFTPVTHQPVRNESIRVCSACGSTLTIERQAKDLDD